MSIPVLTELVADCAICGEIACERDLVYAEEDEFDDVEEGQAVCRDCAGLPEVQS